MSVTEKRKVVVTQHHFDGEPLAYLRARGLEVTLPSLPAGQADGDVPFETLLEWLEGASGWIVGHASVTRELLAALPCLEVISRRGVGYERIDTQAVRELGRVATIAAGANDAAVADQAIGMMLALGRRFRESQDSVMSGELAIPLGTDLYRKTVGVVGLGRIGRSVIGRLRGFDCNVVVYSRSRDDRLASRLGFQYASFPEVLQWADYVTVHVPLTDQTRFMIRDETISLMKDSAYLINTSRGGLVQDRDLLAALKAGRLAGAGLDVFCSEADPEYIDVTRELSAMPNVIATPHSAASTREGLNRTNLLAAQCIVSALCGGALPPGCTIADGRPGRTRKMETFK
ncbi:phosphoglycerate dehydrogenase [Paraburkholderia heleia]|uniref:phosphoglycerate dehydrogenase n=1 Tax=Paraburkholderia heleia TaxID=634127 RepID=UPI0031D81C13